MQELINLIFKVHHIALPDLISLESSADGLAVISYVKKFELPIAKSSTRLKISSARSAAGESYDVTLSANLNEEIKKLTKGIYLVTLESGEVLIIGSADYPVKYNSDELLKEKSFDISHKSIQKPLKIAI